jgi:hypothetical protein
LIDCNENLGDSPSNRGGDLGIDFIGRYFKERLVYCDLIAFAL